MRTLDDWLDFWLELGPQAGRRPQNARRLRLETRQPCPPGDRRLVLQELDPSQLDAIYATMLAARTASHGAQDPQHCP